MKKFVEYKPKPYHMTVSDKFFNSQNLAQDVNFVELIGVFSSYFSSSYSPLPFFRNSKISLLEINS